MGSMTLEATLYTKPGCHLCETALEDLERLQRRHPHALKQVDITADPELFQTYWERIPVLSIAGHEYGAPLERALLERVLEQAAADLARGPTPRG